VIHHHQLAEFSLLMKLLLLAMPSFLNLLLLFQQLHWIHRLHHEFARRKKSPIDLEEK
jgi:hypothetical protein